MSRGSTGILVLLVDYQILHASSGGVSSGLKAVRSYRIPVPSSDRRGRVNPMRNHDRSAFWIPRREAAIQYHYICEV